MVSGISSAGERFLANLNQIQSTLDSAQSRVTSGLRINNASDAPDQIGALLQVHADISRNDQVQTNLNLAKAEVDASDQGLSTAVSFMDQVRSIAAQGLGLNQTPVLRSTLAAQVAGLMQQTVGILHAKVNGRFVFSGDFEQGPLYQYNAASPTGVDRLAAAPATRQVEDSSGGTFPVALSANDIFDQRDSNDQPTSQNVFAAMNAVRTSLLNNDSTGLQAALGAVESSSTWLNQESTFYGSAQNRIAGALTQAGTDKLALQKNLSDLQDADPSAEILRMQQASVQLQAAMTSKANEPRGSLFDLLKGG